MNRENCTSAWIASDQVFVIDETVNTQCGVNLAGYGIWWALLTLMKLIVTASISIEWWRRYRSKARLARQSRERRLEQSRVSQRRLPVVPVVFWLQVVVMILFLVLTMTNTCNAPNGCTLSLFALMHFLFTVYTMFLLRQFLRLGRKVIPIARAQAKADGSSNQPYAPNSSGSGDRESVDPLARADTALQIAMWIQIMFVTVQVIVGLPLQLIIGPHVAFNPNLFLQLVCGLQAGFFFSSMLAFDIQLRRLINATKVGCIKPYPKDVKVALGKMRKLRVTSVIPLFIGGVFTLLVAVGTMPLYWYVMFILVSVESLGASAPFILLTLNGMRRHRRERRHVNRQQMTKSDDEPSPSLKLGPVLSNQSKHSSVTSAPERWTEDQPSSMTSNFTSANPKFETAN